MKNVPVTPPLSSTQHPPLLEIFRAHGRAAMNAPVPRRLLKTTEQPMALGLCFAAETSSSQLSAPPVFWAIYAQQLFFFFFVTCHKKVLHFTAV